MSRSNLRTLVRGAYEQWADIPGFEGYYQASNRGRICSVARIVHRCTTSQAVGGRVLGPSVNHDGYARACLRKDKKSHWFLVSRLILTTFVRAPGAIAEDAAHADGNPLNNDVSNLRWATRAENESDKVRHGTSNRGPRHGNSKLAAPDVKRIRDRYRSGENSAEIAADYPVTPRHVRGIVSKRSWGWL